MSNNPNQAKVDHTRQPEQGSQKGYTSVRILGVFILLVEVGLLFAYGFGGYIINEIGSWGGSSAYGLKLIPVEWTMGG